MKREIKFRAWDENKMIYDGDRIYPSFFTRELKDVCSPVLVSNRDVTFWVHESKLKHSDITYFDHISYLPIKAIMQFTGLKDKNRKEIYEGDIVRHDDPNWGYGGKYDKKNDGYISHEITFEDGCFCLKDGLELYNFKDCEVIGNIYENPELL